MSTRSSRACWSTTSRLSATPTITSSRAAIRTTRSRRTPSRGRRAFPNVHLALCPHDGPTSKADCLNWIYQHVGLYEEQNGERFDIIVTHDAEDLIHPEELRWINYLRRSLRFHPDSGAGSGDAFSALTHGVYCDEFAENHSRDMAVRPTSAVSCPGAGVGTGYRREALEKLARASANRIFEPEALTEDYENGLRLLAWAARRRSCRSARWVQARRDFMATREYFPQTGARRCASGRAGLRASRCRAGSISDGAGTPERESIGCGATARVWSAIRWACRQRGVCLRRRDVVVDPADAGRDELHLRFTLAFQMLRIGSAWVVWRAYMGWCSRWACRFARSTPTLLNSAATFRARGAITLTARRGAVRCGGSRPNMLIRIARRCWRINGQLGEILVGSGHLTPLLCGRAWTRLPADVRLGEYLVGTAAERRSLYEALSLQQGLPSRMWSRECAPQVARALPERSLASGGCCRFGGGRQPVRGESRSFPRLR